MAEYRGSRIRSDDERWEYVTGLFPSKDNKALIGSTKDKLTVFKIEKFKGRHEDSPKVALFKLYRGKEKNGSQDLGIEDLLGLD